MCVCVCVRVHEQVNVKKLNESGLHKYSKLPDGEGATARKDNVKDGRRDREHCPLCLAEEDFDPK